MAFSGMDVDAVEAVSKSLKQNADSLKTLTGDIGREVGRLPSTWEGADARQFADEWWPKHRATLDAITKAIEGLGQSAWNNAQEQRTASGSASSGSGVVTAPTPNPVNTKEGSSTTKEGSSTSGQYGSSETGALPGGSGQAGYDAAKANGQFKDSTDWCTAWVVFRRAELGHPVGKIGGRWGNGGEMAGITGEANGTGVSTEPTLGAIASQPSRNHVMVVESILPGGPPRQIRISEMNWQDNGGGFGKVSYDTLTEVSPGKWRRPGAKAAELDYQFAP